MRRILPNGNGRTRWIFEVSLRSIAFGVAPLCSSGPEQQNIAASLEFGPVDADGFHFNADLASHCCRCLFTFRPFLLSAL
jgi:hypothetical protein